MEFELILAPYIGDKPPESIQSSANHFSLSPLIVFQDNRTGKMSGNYSQFLPEVEKIVEEYGIQEILPKSYLEWVEMVNQEETQPEDKDRDDVNLRITHMLKFLIDGLRSKL